jgi:hypothetical protein
MKFVNPHLIENVKVKVNLCCTGRKFTQLLKFNDVCNSVCKLSMQTLNFQLNKTIEICFYLAVIYLYLTWHL